MGWASYAAATHRGPLGGSYYCLYFDFFCRFDFLLERLDGLFTLDFLKKNLHANFQPKNFQRAVWTASKIRLDDFRQEPPVSFSFSSSSFFVFLTGPSKARAPLRCVAWELTAGNGTKIAHVVLVSDTPMQ